jgi:sulfur relay (sulfurtransferase) complex TusBCD TusD component (DsrE family)
MKALFILNDPPYVTERIYSALRLAHALLAGALRSTMDELAAATAEADKVLVF